MNERRKRGSMTKEELERIEDIIHKTIYEFFEFCGDNEETPMTRTDDLLLEVNKAICKNIEKAWSGTESEAKQ